MSNDYYSVFTTAVLVPNLALSQEKAVQGHFNWLCTAFLIMKAWNHNYYFTLFENSFHTVIYLFSHHAFGAMFCVRFEGSGMVYRIVL